MGISKLSILVLLLVALSACDMKKKLDKMSSTTEKMGNTTDKMSENTDKMRGSTERIEQQSGDLAVLTRYLVVKMREVESITTQKDHMALLLDPTKASGEKLEAALIYFAAMEFQAWDPEFETPEEREHLMLKAVDLFFAKIDDLIDDDMPITAYMPSNNWLALSAMAAAISKVHPDQERDALKNNYPAMSFYDLIKSGFAVQADYDAGKPVAKYQRKILENEKTIRYILQLRHNFFNTIILGKLTSFEEGITNRLWMLKSPWGWTANLDQNKEATLDYLNELLWKSIETQDYLKSIGEPILRNEAMIEVYANGTLETKHLPQTLRAPLRKPNQSLRALDSLYTESGMELFLDMLPESLGAPGPELNVKEDVAAY